ncbi:hypothetical protein [Brevibacillus fortis]|uniref:Uncharacterized protein n=1 Tax=Brevibacillus fortis TaxID=2126352 RepID=A0A2P7V3N9_9BACL|nr:hypothetical protein [Brevibacillus fortis]PSJ93832.1 hypothetical protein C7R93_16755 [Brevibacillus fortis]
MRYRQRNSDGSLGDWVYTPAGEEERKQEEALQKELEALRKENEKLKNAQNGGGDNGVVNKQE